MKSLKLNNKRGLLAVVMALAMVFAATTILVDEADASQIEPEVTSVAKIGETGYETLQAAIDDVTGTSEVTIVLLTNVIEQIEVEEGKDIVLDLNGKTMKNVGEDGGVASTSIITNSGKLTIKDSSDDKTGKVILNSSGYSNNSDVNFDSAITNTGELTLDGVTVERTYRAYYTIDNAGKLTITNSNVLSSEMERQGSSPSLIRNNCGEVIINSGTFTGSGGTTNTYKDEGGDSKLTVNSGTFNGSDGVTVVVYGTATINGGTFNATVGKHVFFVAADDCCPGTLIINDGTIKSSDGKYIRAGYLSGEYDYSMGNITVAEKVFTTNSQLTVSVENGVRLDGTVSFGTSKMSFTGAKANEVMSISKGSVIVDGAVVKTDAGKITVVSGTGVLKDNIPAGVIVEVSEGAILKVDSEIQNGGTIINNGTLDVDANITNAETAKIVSNGVIEIDTTGSVQISGGTVAIQPGQNKTGINSNITSATSEGDALGLNKNLDSDYTITTKAFLEKPLTINEGVTLTISGNATLDLNGQQLVVLGTLVIKNNGIVTTVDDGEILIGKTGVIDNKGVIGKDSAVNVGLYDPQKVSTDNYVDGTVRVKDATGIGFGYKKEVSSGTVNYTLTISGEVSKKGASVGYVTTIDTVYIVDGLTIGNGVLLTAGEGLQIIKNATLDISSKGELVSGGITIANGGTAILDGRTNGAFKAETGSFETSRSYGTGVTKLSTTVVNLENLRGITLQVVSSSGYDERVEADVTERRLVISGEMKDTRTDEEKKDATVEFGFEVDYVAPGSSHLLSWMKYAGFYVDDSLVLGKDMNRIYFKNTTKMTVNGTVSYSGEVDINTLVRDYNPIIGTLYAVEATDENGAKTETQYIKPFADAIGLVDSIKDKTLYVCGPVEISSEITIAADQNVVGSATYVITKDGKLTVSNDATLDAASVEVQGIMTVQVDGSAPDNIEYSAKSEDRETGDITYYGFLIALQNAKAGDVIEISKATEVSDSFTIPEGVTIEIMSNGSIVSENGKTVNMTVVGTLVNEGTLEISGKTDVRGTMDLTEQTLTTLEKDITVSGEIVTFTEYTGSNMNGVFYQNDDGEYVYTTPSKAVAAVSEMDVGRQVTFVGKVSDSTSIVLDDVDMIIPKDATANLGDVTLTKSKVVINGIFSGTIIGKTGAEETTGAVTDTTVVLVKAQSMEIESKTTTNAQNVKVWSTTLKTTDADSDLVGSVEVETGILTVPVSTNVNDIESTVTVGTGAGLLVPKGVTLTVTKDVGYEDKALMTVDGDIEVKGTLIVGGIVIVNGTMDVSNDKDNQASTVNVNDKLVVTGDLVVGEDDVNGDGTVAVGNTGIIVVGVKPSTLGSSGTITGPVDIADGTAGYVLVYASGDVSAAKIEWNDAEEKSAAKSTTFNINNQPYMTVYAIDGKVAYDTVLGAADIELVGYSTTGIDSVADANGTYWFKNVDLTEKAVGNDTIGDDDNLFYRASAVDVQFNVSVGFGISLYIDGLNIKNDTVKLSVGTHTVSATVDPGYTGTIIIAFNGVTVTDGKIVVTPEMASAAYDGAKVVSATGDITTVAPEVSVEDEEDEGLALTDILLIVLVVLIVIMAVIVALRMMRS